MVAGAGLGWAELGWAGLTRRGQETAIVECNGSSPWVVVLVLGWCCPHWCACYGQFQSQARLSAPGGSIKMIVIKLSL